MRVHGDTSLRVGFSLVGAAVVAAGAVLTPVRMARLFAPDGEITQVSYIHGLRLALAVAGVVFILAGTRASKGALRRSALAFASAGLPLCGLELVLRLAPSEQRTFEPAEYFASQRPGLFWENTPGYVQPRNRKSKEPDDRTPFYNSLGMRDEERTYDRSRQSIVVVGDSIENWDIPVSEVYPKRLEATLNVEPGRSPVQVLNFGASGYGLHQKLLMLKYRGLEWKPSHVVVGYCLNDPIPSSEFLAYYTNRPAPLVTLRSVQLVSQRVKTLMHGFGSDFHIEIHREDSESWAGVVRDLHELGRLAAQHQFRALLVVFPLLYDTRTDYPWADIHRRVGEQAQAAGLSVIDLREAYEREGLARIRDDDVHPNARGHAIAAERIYEALTQDGPAGS